MRRTDDQKTTAVRHLSPAQQAVTDQVSSWPGITVHAHRFGGVEFRAGRRELGHLHPAFADLPFPRSVRNALVTAKRIFERALQSVIAEYKQTPGGIEAELAELTAILSKAGP